MYFLGKPYYPKDAVVPKRGFVADELLQIPINTRFYRIKTT